mmetsp:Transcript_30367/g.72054  ORF Transcript_30367/g.72054 Transcript_30367/m.72054 type:complete len:217 (+) Transcript_30367:562-1212(+)
MSRATRAHAVSSSRLSAKTVTLGKHPITSPPSSGTRIRLLFGLRFFIGTRSQMSRSVPCARQAALLNAEMNRSMGSRIVISTFSILAMTSALTGWTWTMSNASRPGSIEEVIFLLFLSSAAMTVSPHVLPTCTNSMRGVGRSRHLSPRRSGWLSSSRAGKSRDSPFCHRSWHTSAGVMSSQWDPTFSVSLSHSLQFWHEDHRHRVFQSVSSALAPE